MLVFPEKAYGRCPIGHNLAPSGDVGDNLSTNEIDAGEGQPLFWSNFYQDFVCAFCLRRVDDVKGDEIAHERFVDTEKKLQGMGIKKA